eukprot:3076187-Rhodomonas_salina.2
MQQQQQNNNNDYYATKIEPVVNRVIGYIVSGVEPWVKALNEWSSVAVPALADLDSTVGIACQGQLLIRSLLQRAYGLSAEELPSEVAMIVWAFVASGKSWTETEKQVVRFVIPALEARFHEDDEFFGEYCFFEQREQGV